MSLRNLASFLVPILRDIPFYNEGSTYQLQKHYLISTHIPCTSSRPHIHFNLFPRTLSTFQITKTFLTTLFVAQHPSLMPQYPILSYYHIDILITKGTKSKVKQEFTNSNLGSRKIPFTLLPSIAPLRRYNPTSILEWRHEEISKLTCTSWYGFKITRIQKKINE